MTALHSTPKHSLHEAAEDGRPRMFFVDATVLQQTAEDPGDAAPRRAPRAVRIDDEVEQVRKNVQDAARAVLTWLAAVTRHDDDNAPDLDAVLRRCLRPSADPRDVNYAGLADEIHRLTGIKLTAKRVQTAIRHLRAAHEPVGDTTVDGPSDRSASDAIRERLAVLDDRLREHFDALTSDEPLEHANLRRQLGTELLGVVRHAAGRVIDRGFGEGIPDQVDLPALEGRFLGYIRDTVRRNACFAAPASSTQQLRRLLVALAEHDGSAESDVKLVMHGAAVAQQLFGPDALPGLLAQLNVLVVGRSLIGTDLYVAEMLRLAEAAEALHDDPATQRYLQWARRLPERHRHPSAVRVASYARSNAATRLFERIFLGTIDPDGEAPTLPSERAAIGSPLNYLQRADRTLADMQRTDSGFVLTLTGTLIAHAVRAELAGDTTDLDAYLGTLGEDKALERLEQLIQFDNSDELVAAVRRHAERVFPNLRQRLLVA